MFINTTNQRAAHSWDHEYVSLILYVRIITKGKNFSRLSPVTTHSGLTDRRVRKLNRDKAIVWANSRESETLSVSTHIQHEARLKRVDRN